MARSRRSLAGRLAVLALGMSAALSLSACDLLEPSEEGGSGFAPASITGKTLTFTAYEGIAIVFSSSTVRDVAGSDVPYTYSKTGDNTASLTVKNSQVYTNVDDSAYSLTFSSASGGTLTLDGESTPFTLQ